MQRRLSARVVALLAGIALMTVSGGAIGEVVKYVRYQHAGAVGYGIVDGPTVRVLNGNFLVPHAETGETVALADVTLLPPTVPTKVLAVGLNYASHAGGSGAGNPQLFAKLPSSLVGHGDAIVLPPDSDNVHYEGEMVIVIGKRAQNVPEDRVADHVFGVSAGNDVSARDWQSSDLQWVRAKASDTFGPVGPVVARGLDYGNLLLETRVNGEVRQSERTSHLIHNVAKIVSFTSRYVTLEPGDLIFTGTPGRTRRLKPGDVVEVTIEGVGTLRNRVVAGRRD
ncbi:MAG: fumarylacetoacetate hydrolase family protein [Alphaproteobacteria bacterium]|nr:fumarylacetoacetate hydrolase family protein [Alphaproteobacteria bacterium]